MDINQLNKRLTIYKTTTQKDYLGFVTTSKEKYYSCWTNKKVLSASGEDFKNYETISSEYVSFCVRRCKKIKELEDTKTFVITFEGKDYNILAIDDSYTDTEFVYIKCKRIS